MARSQPTPEINVTPLVDVVLVLLIIFMVVTPAIANDDRIALPEAAHPDEVKQDAAEPWEVLLRADRGLLLDDEPIAADALRAELERRKRAEPTRKVILLADGHADYGVVREAFAMLQSLGFRGVSLKVVATEGKGG